MKIWGGCFRGKLDQEAFALNQSLSFVEAGY